MLNHVEYTNQLLEFSKIVHDKGHNINISTMTILSNLNVDTIDIRKFCEDFDEPGIDVKLSKTNKDFEMTKRGKIKKTFFNQVTLNYKDVSKKSIKIFSNGKLQLTGITSYIEGNNICEMICIWLSKILNCEIKIIKSYTGLINCNFSINKMINLNNLSDILNRKHNIIARYNPETYPAVNMSEYTPENKKKNNIFIFGTGNIVITGTKSLSDIISSYNFITDICKDFENMKSNTPKKKLVQEKYEGYNLRDYVACLI